MKRQQVMLILIFTTIFNSCIFNESKKLNTDAKEEKTMKQKTMIPIYSEPFYNSQPFKINVGKYSEELKHNNLQKILSVSEDIKKNIDNVNIETLFVLSTRLYDLGAKNEATYWYYLACLKREVFVRMIRNQNIELNQLLFAYKRVLGEFINRDAFSDIDNAVSICRKAIKDNQSMKSLSLAYPKIDIDDSKLSSAIVDASKGLKEMVRFMENNKEEIRETRKENGLDNQDNNSQNTSSTVSTNNNNVKKDLKLREEISRLKQEKLKKSLEIGFNEKSFEVRQKMRDDLDKEYSLKIKKLKE